MALGIKGLSAANQILGVTPKCLGVHQYARKYMYLQYTGKLHTLFRRSRTEWSNFLNRSPERFNIRIPELPSEKDQRFVGYAVRYLRPEVTRSWRVSDVYLSIFDEM